MLLVLVRHGESTNNVLKGCLRETYGHGTDELQDAYDARKSFDPELSDLGKVQAARVAEWLERVYLNPLNDRNAVFGATVSAPPGGKVAIRVACSAMQRAIMTAKPVAEAFGVRAEVLRDAHEIKGCWSGATGGRSGLTASEIESRFPFATCDTENAVPRDRGWWTDDDDAAHHPKPMETSELASERADRMADLLKEIAVKSKVPTIFVLVTHGNFMSFLIQSLLDISVNHTKLGKLEKMFKHQNTAISAFMLPHDREEALRKNKGAPVQVLCLGNCSHIDPCQARFFDEPKKSVDCGDQNVEWSWPECI